LRRKNGRSYKGSLGEYSVNNPNGICVKRGGITRKIREKKNLRNCKGLLIYGKRRAG